MPTISALNPKKEWVEVPNLSERGTFLTLETTFIVKGGEPIENGIVGRVVLMKDGEELRAQEISGATREEALSCADKWVQENL